jgi:retron-type reverse transcriptase
LHELREQYRKLNITWIVDADVSGFFDSLDWGRLREFLQQRVNDGGILRLIGKWLNAGVLEAGELTHPDKGAPQGGVCSPILMYIVCTHSTAGWKRMGRPISPFPTGRIPRMLV